MRKWLALCLLLFLSVASGCGFPQATGGHTETFYRMTDAVGREVVLAKKPERIIILAPSFLNIMHAVGGDFIASADSPGDSAPTSSEDSAWPEKPSHASGRATPTVLKI